MDRQTRNLLLIAVVVILALFLLSGRSLPILGSLRAQEVDLDAELAVPTLDANLTVDPNLTIDTPETVVIDPNVEVTATTITPGPLLNIDSPPGFASGIVHGLISPFMLVLSLFMASVRMYATNNVGPQYDLGFMLGFLFLLALTQVGRLRRYRRG